jgi:asparagine synthase (glutamine-hydrolysing)
MGFLRKWFLVHKSFLLKRTPGLKSRAEVLMKEAMSGPDTRSGTGANPENLMSAQAGIWNVDGRPVDRGLLSQFSESLTMFGPDGVSEYVDKSVALLYRPFHTTRESRYERQPLISDRGFILTWDGRLDNREEVLAILGTNFGPDVTDGTIVAAAFDRWETNCFSKLIGDWAVSVWRPLQRELILSVDYMAIRQIFYYIRNQQVWWATDSIPLVLLSGDKFHIDEEFIAGYFARGPESHITPFREIREVPAGQFVRIREGEASIHRYWVFNPGSRIRYKSDPEYEEHFRHLFSQAVARRLRSDGPVLAELSGGLDSSSIVCVADDILRMGGAQAPRLDTLSFFNRSEPCSDDWMYFRLVEERRGRTGVHIETSGFGGPVDSFEFPKFVPFPGPLGGSSRVEDKRAEVVAQGGYRVTLSGIGGDEFMGGVPNPHPYLADLILQGSLITFARTLIKWSLVKRRPWVRLFGQTLLELLPAGVRQYLAKEAKVENWIDEQFASRTNIRRRLVTVDQYFGLWLPTRRSYMGGVELMARNVSKRPTHIFEEARFPYLDQNLLEFILSIPTSQLLRPGERRSLMRRALAGIVPAEILARKTKSVSARWPILIIERHLSTLRDVFASPLSAHLGYINKYRFLDALKEARDGKEVHVVHLLGAISLEFWLRHLHSRHLIGDDSALVYSQGGGHAFVTTSSTPA